MMDFHMFALQPGQDPLLKGAEVLETAQVKENGELAISCKDIAAAARRIAPYANRTPVMTSTTLNERVFGTDSEGGTVFLKCENFQKVGAFKFRGACNAVFSQEKLPLAGFITHSSGNHGQALALAGKLRKSPVTIVVPTGAPKAKVDAMKGYGATIVESDPATRAEQTEKIAKESGAMIIHPSNEPLVMAGQGTLMAEFWAQLSQMCDQDLQVMVVPVGGGGMLSGVAVAARALIPNVYIIAAEPAIADDTARSKECGSMQDHRDGKVPETIADGLRTTLGSNTWPIVRDLVNEVILVSEEEIIKAMHFVFERLKLVIEPSAAVGVAALLSNQFKQGYLKTHPDTKNVGVVLCGGNLSLTERLPFQNEM
mmetsp:Transcript_16712/g.32464  ORF Transcript_16712/g.32464 Transcript_16712/m.32464 type:complete len:370 (+) Transcript_16712:313-1422(+)